MFVCFTFVYSVINLVYSKQLLLHNICLYEEAASGLNYYCKKFYDTKAAVFKTLT